MNYEKMLSMYNDTLQGRVQNLGIIMGGIPASIYDQDRGVYSYEALRSRLYTGSSQNLGYTDLMTPVIKIYPLSKEEMFILIEKISDIHSKVYEYEYRVNQNELIKFIKIAYMKREKYAKITPRTMIRDFIQILDIYYQNNGLNFEQIIENYTFNQDDNYENNT